MLIPKIFHWIWFGDTPLPDQHRDWIDGWLDLHPGWRQIIWTQENRPTLINEAEFQAADSFAQKADVARYELVCRYGGIYVDTDTECLRSIEQLLDGVQAFVVEGEPHTVENSPIGAVAGHPWLCEVIARLPASMANGWGPMHQAGPRFLTSVTEGRGDVTVFAERLFTSDPVEEWKLAEAYSIHHWQRSWGNEGTARYEAKLHELARLDVEPIVAPGAVFALVDKGHGLEVGGGRRAVPYPERDGQFAGYPANDAEAIAELERLRASGIQFIVFPAPMRYWLEAYPGLEKHLTRNARCVVDNARALIFELPSAVEGG
jgi:hypothetical protein